MFARIHLSANSENLLLLLDNRSSRSRGVPLDSRGGIGAYRNVDVSQDFDITQGRRTASPALGVLIVDRQWLLEQKQLQRRHGFSDVPVTDTGMVVVRAGASSAQPAPEYHALVTLLESVFPSRFRRIQASVATRGVTPVPPPVADPIPESAASERRRLTRRELEIALLAAEGLNNQEIAERLVVSKRTVESHVRRIYSKLGIKGRGQLIRVLSTTQ